MTIEKTSLLTLSTGTGEVVWFLDSRMTIKATANTTGGQFGLVEALVPPGNSPALHIHHGEDEIFWILEGHLTYRCGDQTFPAAPGSYVRLPRGVPHTFVVEGDSNARYLILYVPGGAESYFVEAGRPAEGDGLPPRGPWDIELMARVSAKFQMEIVGPPMKPLSGSQ
jgi:mannose-6-phosphate isomerase-like protein (cupin superfamily)